MVRRTGAARVIAGSVRATAGASVSATLGAVIAVHSYGSESYAVQWQLWWVSNWLGSMAVAPVVIYWSLSARRVYGTLRLSNGWEILAFAVALAGTMWWLFANPMADATSLLQTRSAPGATSGM